MSSSEVDHEKRQISELLIRLAEANLLPADRISPAAASTDADISAALDSPRDFPAISAAIVPGDRIAIPISLVSARVTDYVAAIVNYFVDHDIDPAGVTLCLAEGVQIDRAELADAIERSGGEKRAAEDLSIERIVSDQDRYAYLAADEAADPIYVWRSIVDADFVLPLVASHQREDPRHDPGGIAAHFTDVESRRRWQKNRIQQAETASGIRSESDAGVTSQITWLLGLLAVVHIDETAIGRDALISVDSVERRNAFQTAEEEGDLGLVVFTSPATPTWESVAESLEEAATRVSAGSPLILASDQLPDEDRGFRHLAGHASGLSVWRAMESGSLPLAYPIALLADISRRHPMFVFGHEAVDMSFADAIDSVEQVIRRTAAAARPIIVLR